MVSKVALTGLTAAAVVAVAALGASAARPSTAQAQGLGGGSNTCDSHAQNTYGLGGPGLANGLTVSPGAPVGSSGCASSGA